MTTPRQRPDPNSPHAGRSEKMRNARGSVPFGGSSTSGIGEAPQSRKFKIIIIGVIFLIALFIVMDFVDRANEKKKREERAAGRQTTAIFGDE